MSDTYFPVLVMLLFGFGLVAYALLTRDRVPNHARLGWVLEIVGAAIALVGAGTALFASSIRMGVTLLLLGIFVGIAGLYLFTRPPKA